MKSYITIIGPPVAKTIKALEKIAVDIPDVCIMSTPIQRSIGTPGSGLFNIGGAFNDVGGFTSYFETRMSEERCHSIISKSGEKLGEYDFYFEWFKNPNMKDIITLIEKIDETVKNTGAQYTITTK
jgi:hypothetical protein